MQSHLYESTIVMFKNTPEYTVTIIVSVKLRK